MAEQVAPLSAELERLRQRELVAALDAKERALAEQLSQKFSLVTPIFDVDKFAAFSKWCDEKGVRKCAAKPATVAAFILAQAEMGANDETILATLAAIAAAHDYHGLANPTATAIVKAALDQALKLIEPPRSWPTADRVLFATLPKDIQKIISTREAQRDKWLRQAQNERAKEKENGKHLRQSESA